jgi:hypothetical protein
MGVAGKNLLDQLNGGKITFPVNHKTQQQDRRDIEVEIERSPRQCLRTGPMPGSHLVLHMDGRSETKGKHTNRKQEQAYSQR